MTVFATSRSGHLPGSQYTGNWTIVPHWGVEPLWLALQLAAAEYWENRVNWSSREAETSDRVRSAQTMGYL